MFIDLQKRENHKTTESRKANRWLQAIGLKANIVLVLVLVLIIPTTIGVALIA